MDLRESSSSVQSGNRDGPSPEEDGGHLSVTAALAKDAALLFQSRRFHECLAILNQLAEKKEDDPKIIHNIAITEYFRDGCSDPRKLLEVLNNVKNRSIDLARASGDHADVVSNLASSVASGSKGNINTAHQFSNTNASNFSYADEFDTSIPTLNIAVIMYHLHEYANALSVLEPLYQNIEPIDETTALHICLLLLDIVLASHDASKAADVIQYLEKAFGFCFSVNQGDSGSTTQNQPSNPAIKASIAPTNLTAVDASTDAGVTANSSETLLSRTLSDDAIDYENLLSDLARPATLAISNDRTPPAVDLKLKLHLYKVRLLLLTRNLKAAKREVKLAMNIARGRDSSTALLLKSQLEYARGNHRKSIKLLMTSSNRTESGLPGMFFNNLGCVYHQLQKHHTSTLFFSKALKSSSSLRSEKPIKLSTFSQDKSLLIVYNCGLQYLACGKPIIAARCFQKSSLVFYNRPLLWLRLAECCLMALEKGLLKFEEVKVHVAGNGKWRQLVVGDMASRSRHLDSVKEDGSPNADGQHKLSMPFAHQCLLNALHLLNEVGTKSTKAVGSVRATDEDGLAAEGSVDLKNSNHKSFVSVDSKSSNAAAQSGANGDPKEAKLGSSSNTTIQSSVSAYEDALRRENLTVKQAVLADLAFVELQLENPLKALSVAKSLLEVPDCCKMYIFLGHMYAAESLCRLNMPKEAAEHLLVYVSGRNKVELPYSDEDCEKWRCEKSGGDGEEVNGSVPAKSSYSAVGSCDESQSKTFLTGEEARGALYLNLAAMSAMQGDLEQAHRFATEALTRMPKNRLAVLAVVYVDLLLGKTQDALTKLKECSHVRFFPSNVTLSS